LSSNLSTWLRQKPSLVCMGLQSRLPDSTSFLQAARKSRKPKAWLLATLDATMYAASREQRARGASPGCQTASPYCKQQTRAKWCNN
jgi:hypothetical protein